MQQKYLSCSTIEKLYFYVTEAKPEQGNGRKRIWLMMCGCISTAEALTSLCYWLLIANLSKKLLYSS